MANTTLDPEELKDDPDFPGCKLLTSNFRTKYRDEAIYEVFWSNE